MIGFSGEFFCKLDSKHRLVFPVRLRNKLPESSRKTLFVRKGFENCLTLYPEETYRKIEKRFEGLDEFNLTHRQFKRNFTSSIEEIELDDNFRLLIPKKLIQGLGLKKNITLIGVGDSIEIWDTATWNQESIADPDEFNSLSEEVMSGLKPKTT